MQALGKASNLPAATHAAQAGASRLYSTHIGGGATTP